LLDQNPGKSWQEILGAGVFAKPQGAMSDEEALALGAVAPPEGDDDLVSLKL
jgi:hypothetical protein